eukprot:CAMPEP_0173176378 /NCGR_PEP_ID=MMETSP1141-20130122/4412_1 /TAXON_ID=483371 /ORGANISM="non described non described, Strain CCMP2298" /LENGTH=38 /DNA_ID= /DNA_START= /DNA_END= /DNA_ORIENTATION=
MKFATFLYVSKDSNTSLTRRCPAGSASTDAITAAISEK